MHAHACVCVDVYCGRRREREVFTERVYSNWIHLRPRRRSVSLFHVTHIQTDLTVQKTVFTEQSKVLNVVCRASVLTYRYVLLPA